MLSQSLIKLFFLLLLAVITPTYAIAENDPALSRSLEERISLLEQQLATMQCELTLLKGELAMPAATSIQPRTGSLSQVPPQSDSKTAPPALKISGDIRLRFEPTFQDGTEFRYRGRPRARVNFIFSLNEDLSGGVTVASGQLSDLVTNNQTFTGFFSRKTVGLDQYFLTYRPGAIKSLTLEAGKFVFPWIRTELTFDNDLNPEGYNQRLAFQVKNSVLKGVKLVTFQLPFDEVSAGRDGVLLGGQLQTQWEFSPEIRLGLHMAGLNFRHSDSIARAQAIGIISGHPRTNDVRVSNGRVVGFTSRFFYLDLIGELELGISERWPVTLIFDLLDNARATGDQRTGLWSEIQVGQRRNPGDWQFEYTYIRIEQDAVISVFNASDIRAGSNVETHRLSVSYQFRKDTSLLFTTYLGQLLRPGLTPDVIPLKHRAMLNDPLQTRFQLDLSFRF